MVVCVLGAQAQSGTNSPYSQYALGQLADQSTGFNRGMNGVGLGYHDGNQVNPLNPASYANVDSLSFIFDAGMAGQVTNFKEGGKKLNANNANFEYVVAAFRAFKHVGVSFGVLPYTNIGYSFATSEDVNDLNETTATETYSGSGGLHQVYLGVGWQPFKGFSIGVNGSYLFGDYTRSLTSSYSDSYANTLYKTFSANVNSYKLDFGVQYTTKLSKKDELTLGVTYSPGHKIGGDPQLDIINYNSQTSVSDTTTYKSTAGNKLNLEIPTQLGVGLWYNHGQRIRVGFDYSLQKWAKVESPEFSADGAETYSMKSGLYKDRHKFNLGVDYCPAPVNREVLSLNKGFLKRIHYKAGVSYATPYYYINNQDGPKEISASVGFGIPIMNQWNYRSVLNISAQWVHQTAKNFITENSFRINIGLTFNERMFAKWRVE